MRVILLNILEILRKFRMGVFAFRVGLPDFDHTVRHRLSAMLVATIMALWPEILPRGPASIIFLRAGQKKRGR
jgi:hypothetical protein